LYNKQTTFFNSFFVIFYSIFEFELSVLIWQYTLEKYINAYMKNSGKYL
jgi:hypothetical protein